MRVPPQGLGGRIALGVRALVLVGIVVVGSAFVASTAGLRTVLSPTWLLVLSIPGVVGAGRLATLVFASDDAELGRLERLTRGLAVGWGLVAVAGIVFLQGAGSISLARPGSVVLAAFVFVFFGATGLFVVLGFVVQGERGRLAHLLALVCLWTPLVGAFAVALTLGTPYYWLVVTEATLWKAVGAALLAGLGLAFGALALAPVSLVRTRWQEIGGLRNDR